MPFLTTTHSTNLLIHMHADKKTKLTLLLVQFSLLLVKNINNSDRKDNINLFAALTLIIYYFDVFKATQTLLPLVTEQ